MEIMGRNSPFAVLIVKVIQARELRDIQGGTANPQVKMWLTRVSTIDGELKFAEDKASKKKTSTQMATRNPKFTGEEFNWSIDRRDDKQMTRINLAVFHDKDSKLLKKKTFMGSMSFSLDEIFNRDPELGDVKGWYKLLDKTKGQLENQPSSVYSKPAVTLGDDEVFEELDGGTVRIAEPSRSPAGGGRVLRLEGSGGGADTQSRPGSSPASPSSSRVFQFQGFSELDEECDDDDDTYEPVEHPSKAAPTSVPTANPFLDAPPTPSHPPPDPFGASPVRGKSDTTAALAAPLQHVTNPFNPFAPIATATSNAPKQPKDDPSPVSLRAKAAVAAPPSVPTNAPATAKAPVAPNRRPTQQERSAAAAAAMKHASMSVRKQQPSKSATPAAQEKLSINSFTFLKVLGEGSFGRVLLAELKSGKSTGVYAIKVIKKQKVIDEDDVDATITERKVLALSDKNPFLTRMHATFTDPEKLFYVMEFVNGGDLMYHIQVKETFPVPDVKFYAAEILCGLWYLHDNGVLYRDLKLDNVMLSGEGHIKIADFGMCKMGIYGSGKTTTFCGTPGYLAPEIINEEPYGSSVDFWSLGVLLYEMLIGDSPFDAEDNDDLFKQILRNRPDYPRDLDKASKSIITGFMCVDIKNRLSCKSDVRAGRAAVKSHPFLSTLDWDLVEQGKMRPPFSPVGKNVKDPKDTSNFDDDFTGEDPTITPVDQRRANRIPQRAFDGFSFVNSVFGQSAEGGEATVPIKSGREKQAKPEKCLRETKEYRTDLSRKAVTVELHGKPCGTFFIRESSSQPGCYAIAVAIGAASPWNGLVKSSTDAHGVKRFMIYDRDRFESVESLVKFYNENPICGSASNPPAPVMLRSQD